REATGTADEPRLEAHVWTGKPGTSPRVSERRQRRSGEQTVAKHGIAQGRGPQAWLASEQVIDRDRPVAFEGHPRHQMVLKVLADAGSVANERYAEAAQEFGISDARQLQNLG